MKLRLVSRLMVLALVVVVGVIIILHQHAATSASPAAPPTPTSGAQWPGAPPLLALQFIINNPNVLSCRRGRG
jgi:hypothetical protein